MQSLPLPGEQGDDLYASLLESSLPDMMGTSLSQMQDILPLQTYGSIGMSGLADYGDQIHGVLGQDHASRASTVAEPLERQGPANAHVLDLEASRYSWYVLMVMFVVSDRVLIRGSEVACRLYGWREGQPPAPVPYEARARPRYPGSSLNGFSRRSAKIVFLISTSSSFLPGPTRYPFDVSYLQGTKHCR